jgi:hypothetical protein
MNAQIFVCRHVVRELRIGGLGRTLFDWHMMLHVRPKYYTFRPYTTWPV